MVTCWLNLDNRDIRSIVGSTTFGRDTPSIRGIHLDPVGPIDEMIIRENISVDRITIPNLRLRPPSRHQLPERVLSHFEKADPAFCPTPPITGSGM